MKIEISSKLKLLKLQNNKIIKIGRKFHTKNKKKSLKMTNFELFFNNFNQDFKQNGGFQSKLHIVTLIHSIVSKTNQYFSYRVGQTDLIE